MQCCKIKKKPHMPKHFTAYTLHAIFKKQMKSKGPV